MVPAPWAPVGGGLGTSELAPCRGSGKPQVAVRMRRVHASKVPRMSRRSAALSAPREGGGGDEIAWETEERPRLFRGSWGSRVWSVSAVLDAQLEAGLAGAVLRTHRRAWVRGCCLGHWVPSLVSARAPWRPHLDTLHPLQPLLHLGFERGRA